VILVSAYHDPELVERAGAECVFGYPVKPVKEAGRRLLPWPVISSHVMRP
jgi:hypothetical protein